MPIRPTPTHYHCPACGWSKTVTPRSDALGPGDFYDACPKCGHSDLESRPAGALQSELAQVANTLARLWKSQH